MTTTQSMIEAAAPTETVRRVFGLYSRWYGAIASPLERKPRMIGLEKAGLRPKDKVLEVAVGPGHTFVEILARIDRKTTVFGVDLTPEMLDRTRRRAEKAGYSNMELREADARHLSFPDNTFDVLYNSFMLDLIPLADLPVVLREFHRVLKPGGRLALVNMSKRDGGSRSLWESFYVRTPRKWVPYLYGGCRPVLMQDPVKSAGFEQVEREYVDHVIPSEVVTARKPKL